MIPTPKTPAQDQAVGYLGSLVTAIAAWDLQEWLAVIGLLFGIVTFLTGQYYQRWRHIAAQRKEAREAELHGLQKQIALAELKGFRRRQLSVPPPDPEVS